jgi:AraC-like DNA-binding protein
MAALSNSARLSCAHAGSQVQDLHSRPRAARRPFGALDACGLPYEVQKPLPHGKANRQRVAKAPGLTERTLSQKLGEENTSYNDDVDRLRRSLALEYTQAASISVAQIAWLLGYEGPTFFNHAFARWTGGSALEARSHIQRSGDGKVSKLDCAP